MKKRSLRSIMGVMALASMFTLASCGKPNTNNNNPDGNNNQSSGSTTVEIPNDNTTLISVDEEINNGAFQITTLDGNVIEENNTYKITQGGTYTLTGTLNGQIVVDV